MGSRREDVGDLYDGVIELPSMMMTRGGDKKGHTSSLKECVALKATEEEESKLTERMKE